MVTRGRTLFGAVIGVVVVAKAGEDAALFGLGLGLVIQPHILEALLGYLIVAFARAALLHG